MAQDILNKKGQSGPRALTKQVLKLHKLMNALFPDEKNSDAPAKKSPVIHETTTGAALAHLMLGGNRDHSVGYKYGYALQYLCLHLGEVPDHDSWRTIRQSAFRSVDTVLKRAGISPKTFSTSRFLVERHSPIPIPEPDDFPQIGYLTHNEIRQICPLFCSDKIAKAIQKESDDVQDWLESAIAELKEWLVTAIRKKCDLICFYG
jgi:hypothetical protein